MDGYRFGTLLDLSPVQISPVPARLHSTASPWWRGATEGMWGLLIMLIIGGCSFAAIVCLSGASLALAGV